MSIQVQKLARPGLILCAKQNIDLLGTYLKQTISEDLKPNKIQNVADNQVVLFDNKNSRHLGFFRADQFEKQMSHVEKDFLVIAPNSDWLLPLATSIARSFPTYSRKSDFEKKQVSFDVMMMDTQSLLSDSHTTTMVQQYIESTQLTAELVDMPPNELYTTSYVEKVKEIFNGLPVTISTTVGEDLKDKGYMGIYNVGKGAVHPPTMCVISYTGNPDSTSSTALVGKGVVYDAGGLSIKPTSGMCGMKADMGGSAACVGALLNIVKAKYKRNVHAILCLAENAVDANSFRNDDVFKMFSGKTVEINNTDAEGRLCLGDGVAHATQVLDCDTVIDIATLTGAQMIATGTTHCGLMSNSDEWEAHFVKVGKECNELCHPMLYCPELLVPEFKSEIADLKNSVKDRMNCSSSAAGHFVEEHLTKPCDWIHLDIAGPSFRKDRGTGFGAALLATALFHKE